MDRIISLLVSYAEKNLGLDARDKDRAFNTVLEILGLSGIQPIVCDCTDTAPDRILDELIAKAIALNIIEEWEQETLCDKIMGALSQLPSAVDKSFSDILNDRGAKAATDWLYAYCVKNSYVKRARLDKNPRFDVNGLIVTINKAKPEFRDPKKAALGNSVAGGYPKCVICRENEGYAPRNKRTLTTVSIKLGGEDFFWQYSPYGYFNEHGIAVNCKHIPMYVDKTTFYKLMDFVDIFPHYFIGCNAPLPRIGGSVLAHDHYQGGGEILPLHKARIKTHLKSKRHPELEIGVLEWPGTVIRISGRDRDNIAEVSDIIRKAWVKFSDNELGIVAEDGDGVHNAISPTVTKRGDVYDMNIILRSNITSEEYPDGVFHAHPEYHAIKKESIGLIEAQGLFILPGRLENELELVEECVKKGELSDDLKQFELVYNKTKELNEGDVHAAMQRTLGFICEKILENTAVFKDESQLLEFLRGIEIYE